jgi:hypothetical protein
MSEIKVDKISPRSGTDVTLGDASDTFTIPASATLDVNGTIDVTGATVTGLSAGKVLQVVQGTHASAVSTTGTTYVTTGLSASITPSSTSNKVLVTGYINTFYSYGGAPTGAYIALYRGGSAIVAPAGWLYSASTTGISVSMPFNYLDSPSSTSSLTYEIYMKRHSGTTVYAQDGGPSYITLMEIEA